MSPHYLFGVTPSKSKAPGRWASLLRPHPRHEAFMAEPPDAVPDAEAEPTEELEVTGAGGTIMSPPKTPKAPKSISTLLSLNFTPRTPTIKSKSSSPPTPARLGLDLERNWEPSSNGADAQAPNMLKLDTRPVGKHSAAPHTSLPSISITPPLAQGPHSTGNADSAPPLAPTPAPGSIQKPPTTVIFAPIPPTIDPTPPRLQRLHFSDEPLVDLSKPPMNKYFPAAARTSPSFKFSSTEDRPIYKGRYRLKHTERLRPTQKPSMRRFMRRNTLFYADRTM